MGETWDEFKVKIMKKYPEKDWYYGPDYDPKKVVLRYGKMKTLEQINAWDNHRYGNPDDKIVRAIVLRKGLIGVSAISAIGYGGYKLISHLKSKHDDKKKKEKEML
ncbi:hypothetical protein [Cytobacillus dafuensis]|uniref:Uncharacterized protein n=1 Tax=Cytobacillus dafuensis TaxID=1742359 RepID=A0A5B8Z187_CYTDA|nr:hypothetical protein [Cytobacillus dafuensis]QED46774.1 hypothetical protein FSZ17_05490 [Cytobacillus dafuensis]